MFNVIQTGTIFASELLTESRTDWVTQRSLRVELI